MLVLGSPCFESKDDQRKCLKLVWYDIHVSFSQVFLGSQMYGFDITVWNMESRG